jgi:hypothetical protein
MEPDWTKKVPQWKCCRCGSEENYFDLVAGICRACRHNKCGQCKNKNEEGEVRAGEVKVEKEVEGRKKVPVEAGAKKE